MLSALFYHNGWRLLMHSMLTVSAKQRNPPIYLLFSSRVSLPLASIHSLGISIKLFFGHQHINVVGPDEILCCYGYIYVVVKFLIQVIFVFLLFFGMVMYANEVETKEK